MVEQIIPLQTPGPFRATLEKLVCIKIFIRPMPLNKYTFSKRCMYFKIKRKSQGSAPNAFHPDDRLVVRNSVFDTVSN